MSGAREAAVEAASVLKNLRSRKRDAEIRLAELAEVDECALPALTGNVEAGAKLAALEQEHASASASLRSIESAIRAADRNVNLAEKAVEAERDEQRARETLVLVDEYEALAAELDGALAQFGAAYRKVESK
jgi:hypothetical protein